MTVSIFHDLICIKACTTFAPILLNDLLWNCGETLF